MQIDQETVNNGSRGLMERQRLKKEKGETEERTLTYAEHNFGYPEPNQTPLHPTATIMYKLWIGSARGRGEVQTNNVPSRLLPSRRAPAGGGKGAG